MKQIHILIYIAVVLFTSDLFAENNQSVPQLINYQGYITDENGKGISGKKKVELRLYDKMMSRQEIWGPQIFESVAVVNGQFNVILGDRDISNRLIVDAFESGERYLGIKFGNTGDDLNQLVEISPRQKILSIPYAINALNAQKLVGLDQKDLLENSGAKMVGVFNEFTNSNSNNVQGVLKNLDTAIKKQSDVHSKEFKLLAEGSDDTEEAIITISASGIQFDTDHIDSNLNHVNPILYYWPDEINEIIFSAKNYRGSFCVGGDGVQNLDGKGTNVKSRCSQYRYQGQNINITGREPDNWIRLSINNIKQKTCPDQLDRIPKDGYPGKYGNADFNVFCLYSKEKGHWQDEVTILTIEEVDWSANLGQWEWKIWYR